MQRALNIIEDYLRKVVKEAVSEAYAKCTEEARRYGEVVDVKGASEITGLSVNTIYQLRSRGCIPGVRKVGSRLVFKTEDLRKWVDGGGVKIKETYNPF